MKKIALPIILLFSMIAATAITFPRLSVEQSLSCKSCHVNPSGGGMRTEFGNHAVALNELTLPSTKKYALKHYQPPRLSEAVTIGFDSRYLYLDDGRFFRMQTDFYTSIEPFKNLRYNFRFTESGITENYALAYIGDERWSFIAGRFAPAFGLHNSDHKAFNREKIGFGSNVYMDGLSFGYHKNELNLIGQLFYQFDRSVYNLHLFKNFSISSIGLMAGASLRTAEEIDNSYGQFPIARSLFGGLSYDRFSLLGELDLIGRGNDTLITYLNLTSRLEYGLYFITEYNFIDPNRQILDGVEEFVRFSIEFYPISFVQIRPSLTYYMEGTKKDETDYFIQLHFGY